MKLIKYRKIKIQKNSENWSENSIIDLNFYERQNYRTHIHTHTHTHIHPKQQQPYNTPLQQFQLFYYEVCINLKT